MRKLLAAIVCCTLLPSMAMGQVIAIPVSELPLGIQKDLKELNELRLKQKARNSQLSATTIPRDLNAAPFVLTRQLQPPADPAEAALRRRIADAMLGRGFDLWKGTSKDARCVSFAPAAVIPVDYPPGTVNNDNSYVIQSISGAKDHYRNRSSSLSGSATYKVFSIGAGNSEYSGDHYSSTSRYIDVHVVRVGSEYTGFDGKPTSTALAAIKDGKRFGDLCGQAFVTKVGLGNILDGEVTFDIAVDQSTSGNQSNVDIGIQKILSFGANWGKSVSDLTQYSRVSARIFGGGGSAPTPDALLESARTFGDTTLALSGRQDVLIAVSPYSQVPYAAFRDFPNVAARAEGTVQKFAWDRVQVYDQLSYLKNARKSPSFFNISAADMDKAIAEHQTYLDQLGSLWADCSTAIDEPSLDACVTASRKMGSVPAMPPLMLANQTP